MILNPALFDAAIIDLDGTLVDTMADFVVALNLMLADLSLPQVARAVVDPLVGKGSEHLIRSVLDHVQKRPPAHVEKAQAAINSGADADLNSAARRCYQHHYLAVNGLHVGVYPSVTDGLNLLQSQGLWRAISGRSAVAGSIRRES